MKKTLFNESPSTTYLAVGFPFPRVIFKGRLISNKIGIIHMLIGQNRNGFILQPIGYEKNNEFEFVNH